MVRAVSDKTFVQNISNASKNLRGFVSSNGKKKTCLQTYFNKKYKHDHSKDLDTICTKLTSHNVSTTLLPKLKVEQKLNLLRKISKMEESVFKVGKTFTADQKAHVRAAQKMLVESILSTPYTVNARFSQATVPSKKKLKRDFESERFEQLVSRAKRKDGSLDKISVSLDHKAAPQWVRSYEKLVSKQQTAAFADEASNEVIQNYIKNSLRYIDAKFTGQNPNITKEHQQAVIDALTGFANKHKLDSVKTELILTTITQFGNKNITNLIANCYEMDNAIVQRIIQRNPLVGAQFNLNLNPLPLTATIDSVFLKKELHFNSKPANRSAPAFVDNNSWSTGSQVWKVYDSGKPDYTALSNDASRQLIYSIPAFNQPAFNGSALGVPNVKDYIYEVLTRGYPQVRIDGKHAEKNADMKVFLSYILFRINDPACRNRQKFIDRIADAFAHSCPDVQYGTCQNVFDELTNASNLIGALNVQWQNHKYVVFSSLVQELHPNAGMAHSAYDQIPHLENTYLTLVGDALGLKGVTNAKKDKNLNRTVLNKYKSQAEKQRLVDKFRAKMSMEEFAKSMQKDINNPMKDTPDKVVHIFEITTINKWALDNESSIPSLFKPKPVTTQFGYYSDEKANLYTAEDGVTDPMHDHHEYNEMPFIAMKELQFVMKMANLIH